MAVDAKLQDKALRENASFDRVSPKPVDPEPDTAKPEKVAVRLNPDFSEADEITVSVAGSEPVVLSASPSHLDPEVAALILESPAAEAAE